MNVVCQGVVVVYWVMGEKIKGVMLTDSVVCGSKEGGAIKFIESRDKLCPTEELEEELVVRVIAEGVYDSYRERSGGWLQGGPGGRLRQRRRRERGEKGGGGLRDALGERSHARRGVAGCRGGP